MTNNNEDLNTLARILNGKVALVTGGAQRIGREICLGLAQAGCDIVIHYKTSQAEAEELADEIRALGRQAWIVKGNFLFPEEGEIIMRTAWELAGWVDIVVNNASVFSHINFLNATQDDYIESLNINTIVPALITTTFAKLINESEILPKEFCGRVINIIDQRVHKPAKGCMPYWLSKKALEDFTICSALELAPRITVNGIAPGPALLPKAAEAKEPAGELPLITRCLPRDIVNAVLYLSTAISVSGQILYVDSAQHLL